VHDAADLDKVPEPDMQRIVAALALRSEAQPQLELTGTTGASGTGSLLDRWPGGWACRLSRSTRR
jgi:hypothetical protein